MTTRRSSSTAPAVDNEINPEDAMPGVPPGVDAQVQIKYNARVPAPAPREVNEELNDLALEHDDNLPPDPLSEFLERWANFVGYNCMVLRLPDPSTKRQYGQMYNRPHFGQAENLGAITFDPNPINFINSIQFANGDSGGNFQIWLMDHNGGRIEGGILYGVGIADPPRSQTPRPEALAMQPQPQPREREKSDSERKLEEAKDRLFNTALDRALNPIAPTAPSGNGLSQEDSAALFLLNKTDFLSGIFGKMAELASQAGTVAKEDAPAGWKDRAIDAGLQVLTTNPAIVDRISGTIERIVARVLPDPRFDAPLPAAPPTYYPPQPPPGTQPVQPPPAVNIADLPETADEDNNIGEDEDVDMLDELIVYFNSADELSLEAPVILKLLKKYPLKARAALRLIASQPLDDIIDYVKDQGGALYVSMLDSPVSGPHVRARMAAFKQLCEDGMRKAKEQQAAKAAPPAPATPETEQTQ